jgi:hypothetical protein
MASGYAPTDAAQDWDPLPDQYRWAFGTIKGGPTGFFDSAKTKALQLLGSRRTPSDYLTPARRDAKGRVVGAMSAAILPPKPQPITAPKPQPITAPKPQPITPFTAAQTNPVSALTQPQPITPSTADKTSLASAPVVPVYQYQPSAYDIWKTPKQIKAYNALTPEQKTMVDAGRAEYARVDLAWNQTPVHERSYRTSRT